MIRCTHIRLGGGTYHEHITHIAWTNPANGATGTNTRAEMVTFVEGGGQAYCQDARGNKAFLRVRVSAAGNKYVQTYADGIWTDNLLALPRF